MSSTDSEKIAMLSGIKNFKLHKYKLTISQPWKYIGTHLLLIIGLTLYLSFPAKQNSSELNLITIFNYIFCFGLLLLLAITDPGIMKKKFIGYEYPEYSNIPDKTYDTINHLHIIQGHFLNIKYCKICRIFKQPRTIHCYDCNACIQRFDHHCPWIGNCVGKRNYKYFLPFIISLSTLLSLVSIQSLEVCLDFRNLSILQKIFNVFLLIYCLAGFGFVCSLLGLHLYFTTQNLTTYEYCKKNWKIASGNPFNRNNWWKNCLKVFGNYTKSKISPNEEVFSRRKLAEEQDKQGDGTASLIVI